MASNQEKLDQLVTRVSDIWHGLFGDKQVPLWERVAEIIAPKIAYAVLLTEFNRRDGEPITLAGQQSWAASDTATIRGDIAALRELVAQLAGSQGATIDYDKVGRASAEAIKEYVTISSQTTTTVELKES